MTAASGKFRRRRLTMVGELEDEEDDEDVIDEALMNLFGVLIIVASGVVDSAFSSQETLKFSGVLGTVTPSPKRVSLRS